MRKLSTVLAVAALATVALLVPSTAQAAAPDRDSAVQLIITWKG